MKTIFTTKFLAILALATMTLTSAAQQKERKQIEVDGIYYELYVDKLEAQVINHPQGYSGVVMIPETVMDVLDLRSYTVTIISNSAFKDCDELLAVGISSTVNDITPQSFMYCKSLEEIYVDPDNETYASYDRALYDKAMTTIIRCPRAVEEDEYKLPEGVTTIGESSFSACKNIKKIILPNSVNFIDSWGFYNCASLESINLPDGITEIGQNCFRNCNGLKEITIPANVTTIGNWAFKGCKALADVTNLSTVPQTIDEETFSNFGTLHVPAGSEQLYAQAEGWSKFNIVGDAAAPDAIGSIKADRKQTAAQCYGIDGKVLQTGTHRGITIVRTKDGKTRKMISKKQ